MTTQRIQRGEALFYAGLAAIGFLLFLGAPPLFDWDEINFAESAREMIVSGDYLRVQINYQPFWEKPPLFFWLQVLSMKLFGVNEFAARFPNALIGVITILTLYITGTSLKDRLFGRLLVGIYMATLLPIAYFKSGIIDPTFNFFIFLGLIYIFRFDQMRKDNPAAIKDDSTPYAAGFWIGLATLTKGPVALLVAVLIYGLYKAIFDRFRIPIWATLKFVFAWIILVAGWYGVETLFHGSWFLENFFQYQWELLTKGVAGHEQPFYYHAVVFLLGCFPMAAFTFRGMFHKFGTETDRQLRGFMTVWFWVIMVLFSIATTKIIHYSSLLYFPAAFLSAYYLYQLIREEKSLQWDSWVILGLGIVVWGVFPSLVNWAESQLKSIAASVDDPFMAAQLKVEVEWGGWEWIIGAIFLLGILYNLTHLKAKRYLIYLWIQVGLSLLFINLTYKVVVPKVAQYTQGSPQEFFAELAGKDVYVMTAGYKSYLPYFYGKIKPHTNEKAIDHQWLIEGAIDKDVYLSVKANKINEGFRRRFRNFERLHAAGGFVFFRRKAIVPLRASE